MLWKWLTAQQWHTKVTFRTIDTDVVVLAVAKFLQIGLKELWVAFGTGKHYEYIQVQEIVSRIGQKDWLHLLLFHAFTGCDTVSFFSNNVTNSNLFFFTPHEAKCQRLKHFRYFIPSCEFERNVSGDTLCQFCILWGPHMLECALKSMELPHTSGMY